LIDHNKIKAKNKMTSTHNFDFIQESDERNMYLDAHKSITRCELWDWLKTYTPDPNKGFMYSTPPPEMQRINEAIDSTPSGPNHSGASYGHTMRVMQYIAKNGYDSYKNLRISRGSA
jgi:hypothetical protein